MSCHRHGVGDEAQGSGGADSLTLSLRPSPALSCVCGRAARAGMDGNARRPAAAALAVKDLLRRRGRALLGEKGGRGRPEVVSRLRGVLAALEGRSAAAQLAARQADTTALAPPSERQPELKGAARADAVGGSDEGGGVDGDEAAAADDDGARPVAAAAAAAGEAPAVKARKEAHAAKRARKEAKLKAKGKIEKHSERRTAESQKSHGSTAYACDLDGSS